jgi:hypothetical protein
MKIRNGFVSNSSSSSFFIAYRPEHYKKDIYLKVPSLIKDINEYLEKKGIKYKSKNEDNNWHDSSGAVFLQESDTYVGFRSYQSVLDHLELNTKEEADDFGLRALKFAEEGWHILIGQLPHDGDGGSELSNYMSKNPDFYFIKTDNLITQIENCYV